MKKVLTWMKITGQGMHIWNYLWWLKNFLDYAKWNDAYLFLADLHSLTTIHDPEILKINKKEMLLDYFSLIGEDFHLTIYEQSKIKKIADINWILNSVTPYSLMLRAHSFKDSKNKNSDINMAVFNYPILMAADIISYDTDVVPVWKDQTQHIEFARDIAQNFNKIYKTDFFKLPKIHTDDEVMLIPWLDGRKMSKSYGNDIKVFETDSDLKKKIMSIETDNTPLEAPKDPEKCNIFELIKFFASENKQNEIKQKYLAWNYGYWHAKLELFDILKDFLKPFKKRRDFLKQNFDIIEKKLEEWNRIANDIVDRKYTEIMKIVGL
jgi:tryptophanyl-tRNA synthetase